MRPKLRLPADRRRTDPGPSAGTLPGDASAHRPRFGQPGHIISTEPGGDSGGSAACAPLELLFGALTCDDGTVGGQAGGIAFVRVLDPVQVVTTWGRSLDLPVRASGGCRAGHGGRGDRHGRD